MTAPVYSSPRKRQWRRWWLKSIALLALILVLLPVGERIVSWLVSLPAVHLQPYRSSVEIRDVDGMVLRWADPADGERRHWVPLARISPALIQALVAGEDRRFYSHGGVDAAAVFRALWNNTWLGRRTSGGSTLTMQVARLIDPAPRTWAAKIREAFRARQIERQLSKDDILEQYCNRAPWGGRLRGIEAASRHWFGIAAADLSPAQAAMLVAMLPAPSRRSPTGTAANAALLRERRDGILVQLPLTDAVRARALATALPQQAQPFPWLAAHACDAALRDAPPQVSAITLELRWSEQQRLQRMLSGIELPVDGLAVVVADYSGAIRAHLGSRDWQTQPFDAARAQRAAGSTLKPFLYRRAFADGLLAPATPVADRPMHVGGWKPGNEDDHFLGTLPADEALWRSRNPPAVAALVAVGLGEFANELAAVGLPIAVEDYSTALGSSGVSPIALARAYAALARAERTSPATAAVLTALRNRPLAIDRIAPGSVAWKTGTSSQRRDAWCVAITSDRVIVVWTGCQDGRGDPHLRGRDLAREICAVAVVACGSVALR